MADTLNRKQAKAVNLYFGAALVVLILTTALLITLLKSQSGVNYQAKLIVEQTEAYKTEITQQKSNLAETQRTLQVSPTSDVLPADTSTNQITRMLDDYFASLPGNAVNSTLSFTDFRTAEDLNLVYTDATLTLVSSESNFYEFLRYVETSGFSSNSAINLMEVRSISINFSSDEQDDTLNYRVTLRIYFNPGLQAPINEEQTQ